MATSGGFSLSLPVVDDTMEMSSPGNAFEEDIDIIDFDDYAADAQPSDDEQMLEDGDHTRPATATDEMMDDGLEQSTDVTIAEEVMQDGPVTQPFDDDDDLIDYDDDDYDEPVVLPAYDPHGFNTVDSAAAPAPSVVVEEPEQVDEEIVQQPDGATVQVDELEFNLTSEVADDHRAHLKEPVGDRDAARQAADQTDLHTAPHQAAAAPAKAVSEPVDVNFDIARTPSLAVNESHQEALDGTDHGAQPDEHLPLAIDTDLPPLKESSPTPTDTGLHPMTVQYYDSVFPLFKSRTQRDGLLKDDNLASVGLAELMQSCRQRLAGKIGEQSPEDQELHLRFDQLGLSLVEDSRPAFEISLNDVLEIFLHLHQNAATAEVPALSLDLSWHYKFSSSLDALRQAASEGHSITDVPALLGLEEGNSLDNEEYVDTNATDQLHNPDTDDVEGENYHDVDNVAQVEDDANAGSHGVETHPESDEKDYQEADGLYNDEYEGEEYYDEKVPEGAAHEESYEDEYPDPQAFGNDFHDPTESGVEAAGLEQAELSTDEPKSLAQDDAAAAKVPAFKSGEDASTASSETVRGDSVDDATDEKTTGQDTSTEATTTAQALPNDEKPNGQDTFNETQLGKSEHASTLHTRTDAVPANKAGKAIKSNAVNATGLQTAEAAAGGLELDETAPKSSEHEPERSLDDRATGNNEQASGNHQQTYPDDQKHSLKETSHKSMEAENQSQFEADTQKVDNEDELTFDEDDEQFHTALDFSTENQKASEPDQIASTQGYKAPPDEDDIGFDVEDDFLAEPQQPVNQQPKIVKTPLGKRSFEDLTEVDDLDFDLGEPEAKKVRAD